MPCLLLMALWQKLVLIVKQESCTSDVFMNTCNYTRVRKRYTLHPACAKSWPYLRQQVRSFGRYSSLVDKCHGVMLVMFITYLRLEITALYDWNDFVYNLAPMLLTTVSCVQVLQSITDATGLIVPSIM
jgi:hypothetical protein